MQVNTRIVTTTFSLPHFSHDFWGVIIIQLYANQLYNHDGIIFFIQISGRWEASRHANSTSLPNFFRCISTHPWGRRTARGIVLFEPRVLPSSQSPATMSVTMSEESG